MGGSGGGGSRGFGSRGPEELRREARAAADEQSFAAEVNGLLRETLADVNTRDAALVRDRLDGIETALGQDAVAVERLLFGGSIAKSTYVDGLSDVDALVVLDAAEHGSARPAELIEDFARTLRNRLKDVDVEAVKRGTMAVTVRYKDGPEIQILPAFRRGDTVVLSNEDGTAWRRARPGDFAAALTKCNQSSGGNVVPTIKLAKLAAAQLPESRRPSGYHVEAMAVEAFQGYQGPTDRKSMVTHFFRRAADLVQAPLGDRTGQSRHVDESLGPRGSIERRAVADSLARIARQMETTSSVAQWRAMLGLGP